MRVNFMVLDYYLLLHHHQEGLLMAPKLQQVPT